MSVSHVSLLKTSDGPFRVPSDTLLTVCAITWTGQSGTPPLGYVSGFTGNEIPYQFLQNVSGGIVPNALTNYFAPPPAGQPSGPRTGVDATSVNVDYGFSRLRYLYTPANGGTSSFQSTTIANPNGGTLNNVTRTYIGGLQDNKTQRLFPKGDALISWEVTYTYLALSGDPNDPLYYVYTDTQSGTTNVRYDGTVYGRMSDVTYGSPPPLTYQYNTSFGIISYFSDDAPNKLFQ